MEQVLLSGLERMIQAIEHRQHPILLASGSNWPERLTAPPRPSVWQREKHPFHELAYVDKGACAITLGNSAYRLHSGGLCVVPPGQEHYESPSEPNSNYTIYWLHTADAKLTIHATEYATPGEGLRHLVLGVDTWLGKDLSVMFQRIFEESKAENAFSDTIIRGYLLSLIGLVSRQVHEISKQGSLPDPILSDPVIRSVCQFVQENYADPDATVTAMANHVALSPNYLSVYFRKQTGSSPYHFLLQTRMKKARELLLTTNYSISKIAEEVGFLSPYHFSASFKRLNGDTPTAFRKEGRQLSPLVNADIS